MGLPGRHRYRSDRSTKVPQRARAGRRAVRRPPPPKDARSPDPAIARAHRNGFHSPTRHNEDHKISVNHLRYHANVIDPRLAITRIGSVLPHLDRFAPLNPRCMGRERRVEGVRELKILQEEHVRLKNLVGEPRPDSAILQGVA